MLCGECNIANIGNMVLFLKRIPNPIGIWNAEYSRHRNKGDKRLPLVLFFIEWSFLDTAPESFLYWWRHHFVDPPSPLSSYVIILQTPLPPWRWRNMWMPPNLKILCLNWPIALRKIYLLSFFENGDKSKKTSAVLTLRPESCIGKSIAR